jgi:two-component system alkaline phosphatase synthesis response regulator PhoP
MPEPAHPSQPDRPAQTAAPEEAPGEVVPPESVEGMRVLLVDDNVQNLELLQAYLEDLGCEISVATDGQAAIDSALSDPPDIILLDIMMPRVSGFQACQKIKRDPRTRHIPVIMVTALNEVGDVERAVDCGADDFLTKPVQKVELLTRVRSLLRLSRLQRELEDATAKLREAKRQREG